MELALNLPVVHPAVTGPVLGDLAARAEDLGYSALYLGEHVVLFDAPDDEYPGSDTGEAFFPADSALPIPSPPTPTSPAAPSASGSRPA